MSKNSPDVKRYVVFYDIDGVLTTLRTQIARHNHVGELWNTFDKVAIDLFNKVYIESGGEVSFVCMSTWRNHIKEGDTHSWHLFTAMLRSAGFIGHIPYPDWRVNKEADHALIHGPDGRAEEVRLFLLDHPEVKDFIVVDDSRYKFNELLPKKRFVKTDPENGFMKKSILNMLSLAGAWKEL